MGSEERWDREKRAKLGKIKGWGGGVREGGKRMEWSRGREGDGRGKVAGKETQKEGWLEEG